MASEEYQERKRSSSDWDELAKNLNDPLAGLELEEVEEFDPITPNIELDKQVEQRCGDDQYVENEKTKTKSKGANKGANLKANLPRVEKSV